MRSAPSRGRNSAVAAIGLHFNRGAPRLAAVSLYAAVLLTAGGLAFTAMAAPIMLGVRGVSDHAALRRAFEGFWYWGDWRALCQALAFLAQLAALAMLLRGDKAAHP
jgi:hypothetical protein